MDKTKNYNTLRKYCLSLGADLFGVADISGIKDEFALPKGVLEKYNTAISLGARLSVGLLAELGEQPTPLYYLHYRTVNYFLDQLALKVNNHIQNKGNLALPVPATQIVDWQTQKAHISHKRIGYLAGLGWMGRNNLLVNKRIGSQFRLVTVLTDMPLKHDLPVKEDCGKCFSCVTTCPVGAIKNCPADFEYVKCSEKLKEFEKLRLVNQRICGICVKACSGKSGTKG